MSKDIKDEIIAAIAKNDDSNMKTVLLLMLAVVGQIGDKIDAMRNDEHGLRTAVLNGHEPVHHAHHEWVARKIQDESEDAAADKESKRKIRDGLIERALWFCLVLILAAYGLIAK